MEVTAEAAARAVAHAVDGWALAGLGVLAFVLLERHCGRASHWRCLAQVLGPLLAAAALAALTPNLFDSHPTASGVTEIPSRGAGVGAAITVILVGRYGVRGLPYLAATAFAAVTWVVMGISSAQAVMTGLFIGAGTGMMLHAPISGRAGRETSSKRTGRSQGQ